MNERIESIGDIELFARELIVAARHAEIPLDAVLNRLRPWPTLCTLVWFYWTDAKQPQT